MRRLCVYRKREGPGTAVSERPGAQPEGSHSGQNTSCLLIFAVRACLHLCAPLARHRDEIKSIMCSSTLTRVMMCVHTHTHSHGSGVGVHPFNWEEPTKESNIFVLRRGRCCCWWQVLRNFNCTPASSSPVERRWCTDAAAWDTRSFFPTILLRP